MSYFAFEAGETSYEDEELEKELEARVSAFVISDLENFDEDSDSDDDSSTCHDDEKSGADDEFDFSQQLRELSSYSNLTSIFFEDFQSKSYKQKSVEIKEDNKMSVGDVD